MPAVPAAEAGWHLVATEALASAAHVLGQGDRLELLVSGGRGVLTGTYLIGAKGRLAINASLDLLAAGR